MSKHTPNHFVLVLFFLTQMIGSAWGKEGVVTTLTKEQLLQLPFDTLWARGNSYYDLQMPGDAIYYLDAAAVAAQKIGIPKKIFNVWRLQGLIHEDFQQYTDAIKAYRKAEVVENLTSELKNYIYTDLAICYRKNGEYQNARDYHNKALDLAIRNNDLESIENSYDGLGTLFSIADDFDNAIKNYLKSLQIAEQRNNKEGAVISLKNIADCYRRTKDFKQALENVEKAYRLSLNVDNTKTQIEVLGLYGDILGDAGRTDAAFQKLNEGLDICIKFPKYENQKYKILVSKADLLHKSGKIDAAQAVYLECLSNKKVLGHKALCSVNLALGDIYFKQNDLKNAFSYLNTSLKIANEYKFYLHAEGSHRNLYEIYKSQSKLDKALFHLESANTLRDSIFTQEKTKRVAELQFRYQLERNDKEIQEFKLRENNFI
jgi:tetratricopeptide (TPR) repeat protein